VKEQGITTLAVVADASEVTVVKVSKWPWYGKGLLNDEADLIC